jgi:putative phosphoribosyl transferase
MSGKFRDRTDAGARLAAALAGRVGADPVVLALPRGGVPVGAEVARRLGAPLDLLLVRKIGMPSQPELALAALGEGTPPVMVRNPEVARFARLDDAAFARLVETASAEIARRRALWLAGRPPLPVAGRCAIVVDDGAATGASAEAAIRVLRARGPARIVLALPVAPPEARARLARLVDDVVCLETPAQFVAVGAHYDDFAQLDDAEVARCLATRADSQAAPGSANLTDSPQPQASTTLGLLKRKPDSSSET